MIALLARPLAVVAAIGWIATIAASAAGFAGAQLPSWLQGALFIGVFPLWFVVVLLMNRLTAGVTNNDMWKAAFRGCPTWLRYAIWGSWGYTALCFIAAIAGRPEVGGIGFVGVFYAASLGTFVTATTTGDEPSECANGHKIGPFDKFCRECGVAINRADAASNTGSSRTRRVIP
jgi:hypothetical protein